MREIKERLMSSVAAGNIYVHPSRFPTHESFFREREREGEEGEPNVLLPPDVRTVIFGATSKPTAMKKKVQCGLLNLTVNK